MKIFFQFISEAIIATRPARLRDLVCDLPVDRFRQKGSASLAFADASRIGALR